MTHAPALDPTTSLRGDSSFGQHTPWQDALPPWAKKARYAIKKAFLSSVGRDTRVQILRFCQFTVDVTH